MREGSGLMTLIARLCALCAVCALMQMALGETDGQGGLRMLGGLLMLHLVLSGAQELAAQLAAEKDLMHIFAILVK